MIDDVFDVVAAFGGMAHGERIAVYIPNKDKDGNAIVQRPWVDEAVRIMAEIGGGATAMPPVTGAWLNPESGNLIIEEPVVVYSFIHPDIFIERHKDLLNFVRRMGREANQGAVGMEYGGTFFTIENFS